MKSLIAAAGFALMFAGLTACTSARPLMAPSGAMGFKVWCEFPSQCYEKAAQVCPRGYTIEANEKDYWGMGDFDGNLIIVCKQPSAAALTSPAAAPTSDGAPQQAPAANCVACKNIKTP